jgi:cyclopropane fatty-acyl-phospholipid synthase-like methyltransferase
MRRSVLGVLTATVASACGAGPASSSHGSAEAAAHAGHRHHEHGGGMPHRFENAEAWAQVFDDPERDAWQRPDEVLRALELSPAMTVADVGAGTGYFAMRLARAVPEGQVLANDIEPDMVRYLDERARREGLTNVRALLGTATSSGLSPASVDRVLVVDVWHHLGDRVAYARDLATALRDGGRIYIVDFTLEAERGPPAQHRLAAEAIMADLTAAGLVARVVPADLPDQYIVEGRMP